MSKVLIELEKSDSTTEYIKASFTLVFKELDTTPRFKFLTDINNEDLNWCDVYLAVRPFTPLSLRIAKAIKETNRFYAVFYGDSIENIEAMLLLYDFIFIEQKFSTIVMNVDENNRKVLSIHKKFGAKYQKTIKLNDWVSKQYFLSKSDYFKRREKLFGILQSLC